MKAPGRGSWAHDSTHYPHALPRLHARALVAGFTRGFAEAQPIYGTTLEALEHREVEGFVYTQAQPVGAPLGAKAPPPPLLWLMLRVHPKVRARIRAARTLFRRKPWLEDLRRWDEEVKPRHVRRYLALVDVNVESATDADLAKHIVEVYAELEKAIFTRARFTTPALFPIAHYAVRVSEWLGVHPSEALRDVHGGSAISRGWIPELAAAVNALEENEEARRLLDAPDKRAALAALESRRDDVGANVRELLRHVGYRLVSGYDLSHAYGREMPHVIVDSLRAAMNRPAKTEATPTSALRERIPSLHRTEFDELFAEANLMMRLRDDRTLYCDVWVSGILRRAVLEAGRRLVQRGDLACAADLIEATAPEMTALLRAETGAVDKLALAQRAAERAKLNEKEPPPILGDPPSPPPPIAIFPKAFRIIRRIEDMIVKGLYVDVEPHKRPPAGANDAPKKESDAIVVRGIGVSNGVYEGRACVVRNDADLHRIASGDVLVATATSPAYTHAIAFVGAIVTDRGGALTHAAIMTREHGIPGVVGTRDATRRIEDGARVRVDGTKGEVTVIS